MPNVAYTVDGCEVKTQTKKKKETHIQINHQTQIYNIMIYSPTYFDPHGDHHQADI